MAAWETLDVRLARPPSTAAIREGVKARQAVEAEQVYSGRDPSPLRHEMVPLAASGVASSQPARPCLASAWSTCRPMCRVLEVVSKAIGVLRSFSPHALAMSEAVGRRGIVLVTSGWVACSS